MNRSRFSLALRGIASLLACLTLSASAQVVPANQPKIAACADVRFCAPESILGHTLAFERQASSSPSARAAAIAAGKTKPVPVVKACRIRALRYFVRDLGSLGGTKSFAYALNSFTQIVGSSRTAGDAATHSFIYSNGKMSDLAPLNSGDIQTVGPTGINFWGQVASGVMLNGVYQPALLDTRTHHLTPLGTLGGVTSFNFSGVATSVNFFSDAVGYSYVDSLTRHAFFYHHGTLTDLDPFGTGSAALSINDFGLIAGFAANSSGSAQATVYRDGSGSDIDPVGLESYARDVNNLSDAVGEYLIADGSAFHAFVYSNGGFNDLGVSGSPETVANAINDLRQIAGTMWIPYQATCGGAPCTAYMPHAFTHLKGNNLDLNQAIPPNSGWELNYAFDINNQGNIVGYGLRGDNFRAFLLTPAIDKDQCKNGAWKNLGFKNQGSCIRYINTDK
jgi:probable HAF family extracellular repeat protein